MGIKAVPDELDLIERELVRLVYQQTRRIELEEERRVAADALIARRERQINNLRARMSQLDGAE